MPRIFQYGSNMDIARLESRIGNVKDLGAGLLSNYSLVFDLHSKGNNCAVASIVPTDFRPEAGVSHEFDMRGLVFGRGYEINEEQARRLTSIEGRNYRKETVNVQHIGSATTFVGTDKARASFRQDFEGELPSKE